MSPFLGADTEALRAHARVVTGSGARLEELGTTLRSAVDGVTWAGPDADAFREDFSTRVSGVLGPIADTLRTRAEELAAEADEQDEVSAADGATGPGGQGTGGTGPLDGPLGDNPLTRMLQMAKDGFSAVGKVMTAFRQTRALMDFVRALDTVGDAARSAETFIRSGMLAEATRSMSKLGSLGRFAGGGLGVLSIVGGVSDMINPPHDGWRGVGDRIAGGMSVISGAGGLAVALGAGAALGPVGLGAIAIIGAGAALWTAGNAIYDNWDSISAFAGDAVGAVKDFGNDVADTVGDAVDGVGDFVGGLFS